MSRSARLSLALVAVGLLAVAWVGALRADQDGADGNAAAAAPAETNAAAPSGGAVVAEPFDHELHEKLGVDMTAGESCGACHSAGADGTLLPIADKGHKPCLDARCHAMDFIAVGPRMRQADPGRFADAAAFCAGCHPDGTPVPWKAASAAVDYADGLQQFHVEMNHFEHVEGRAKCRDCHVVEEATFALALDSPGHGQCSTCHDGSAAAAMSSCGSCHAQPAPSEYFAEGRKRSDVRSCGSPAHEALVKKRGGPAPCFKHERAEHRQKGGERLECGACHYMFEDKKHWGKDRAYDSLKDIKAAPLIDNNKDIAHEKVCGGASCHARDVRPPPRGNCTLCHDAKISEGLFD